MMRILFVLLLFVAPISAEINEKFSFKDFMHVDFSTYPAKDFNNSTIKGSCFYQESEWSAASLGELAVDPRKSIFPAGMTGVIFDRCNLGNVVIPIGNTVLSNCASQKIRIQNDNEDWVLGVDNKPTEPVAKEKFIEEGKSILVKDIPAEKQLTGVAP